MARRPAQNPEREPGPKSTKRPPRRPARRCNDLPGRLWIRNSISVWSDIRKSPDELRLRHPAMFPSMLAERLIESFLPAGPHLVLDPFAGTGSTLAAAQQLGKCAVGLEISPEYLEIASRRLRLTAARPARGRSAPRQNIEMPAVAAQAAGHADLSGSVRLYQGTAADLLQFVGPASVDLCVTSPPYWNILNQARTADFKEVRHYGNLGEDLGTIAGYDQFLDALARVFELLLVALKPGAHCAIVVMDLRKKDRFYPFHSDLATRLQNVGYRFDDLVVWNRQAEYNNLRPLGYPAVFRINKVHEFVLLMQKPR